VLQDKRKEDEYNLRRGKKGKEKGRKITVQMAHTHAQMNPIYTTIWRLGFGSFIDPH
jgi:hypothetical protein